LYPTNSTKQLQAPLPHAFHNLLPNATDFTSNGPEYSYTLLRHAFFGSS